MPKPKTLSITGKSTTYKKRLLTSMRHYVPLYDWKHFNR